MRTHRPSTWSRVTWPAEYAVEAALAALAAAAVLLVACGEPASTPTSAPAPRVAKGGNGNGGENGNGGNGEITVRSTDPDTALQGVSLQVRIKGKNFEPGDVAEFLLDEQSTDDITTHSTTFVSSRELAADITVSETAALDFYDVEVTGRGNRRGIGIEIFEVVVQGNQDFPTTITLRAGSGDGLLGDAEGPSYSDGVRIANGQNEGVLFIGISDPRGVTFDYGEPVEGTAGCAADSDCRRDFDQVTVGTSGAVQVLRSQDSGDVLPRGFLGMAVDDTLFAKMRLGFTYPPDDKKAPRYQTRFQFHGTDLSNPINAEIAAESDYLMVTRTAAGRWILWTPTAADGSASDWGLLFSKKNKGPKRDRETRDEGSFHMPFEMTVTCAACPAP